MISVKLNEAKSLTYAHEMTEFSYGLYTICLNSWEIKEMWNTWVKVVSKYSFSRNLQIQSRKQFFQLWKNILYF